MLRQTSTSIALIGSKPHVEEIYLLLDKFCPDMFQLFGKDDYDKAMHWLKQV